MSAESHRTRDIFYAAYLCVVGAVFLRLDPVEGKSDLFYFVFKKDSATHNLHCSFFSGHGICSARALTDQYKNLRTMVEVEKERIRREAASSRKM